jgi:hypothetical protein
MLQDFLVFLPEVSTIIALHIHWGGGGATIESFLFKKFAYCSHDLPLKCCDSCMMIRHSSLVDSIDFVAVPPFNLDVFGY